MYKIVRAEELTTNIYLFEVEAKRVAKACLPGQFVIVRTGEDGERIPLTISDYNREKGTITIVVQTIGAGTNEMRDLKAGDFFHDFVGPLGQPSEFCKEDIEELKKKKIIFVAGGLGKGQTQSGYDPQGRHTAGTDGGDDVADQVHDDGGGFYMASGQIQEFLGRKFQGPVVGGNGAQ